MTLNGRIHFAVRSLPSPSGLDGAFRVYISPEHLDQLGLRVGDVCEISSGEDDSNVIGYAIAWRATDKMGTNPKQKPVKVSDTLRMAFNIKEGGHVNLGKTDVKIVNADRVVLSDVTPTEYSEGNQAEMEEGKWWWRCGSTLSKTEWRDFLKLATDILDACEAFASGITFDVTAKKGVKKRFYIEHIEAASVRPNTPALFSLNDQSKLVIGGPVTSPVPSNVNGGADQSLIDARDIGGLVEQIEELNDRMRQVLKTTNSSPKHPHNLGTLIHGPQHTGKSMLLERMNPSGFRKVLHVTEAELDSLPPSKAHSAIQSTFDAALDSQPSLILIDDIQNLAPATGKLYGTTIALQLDRIFNSRVLVVATCRDVNDVSSSLISARRLSMMVELPIPDHDTRIKILNVLIDQEDDPTRALSRSIGRRTHGFTGHDLSLLAIHAREHARKSSERRYNYGTQAEGAASYNGTGQRDSDERTLTDAGDVDGVLASLTMDDFDFALTKVQPTALREFFFEKPQIEWSDIGGSEDMQARFDQIIGWPLYHRELMEKFGLEATKGVLLYGPPGCSKTLTAQAVAKTYDLNFIAVQGAELISMYVGESERAIRDVFRKARAAAPCIVFFDEIDSIASARESGAAKGLQVLTTLLNEMDGFRPLKNVLILAATNKPEVLDPAILRPGRFGEHIYIGLPNSDAREEIFGMQMKGVEVEDFEGGFTNYLDTIMGYTGAEITEMCQRAKLSASRRAASDPSDAKAMVLQKDLKQALLDTGKMVTPEMLEGYKAFAPKAFDSQQKGMSAWDD